MGRKKKEKLDTINIIFCDRCGTLYNRIKVSDDLMMPMCRVCHMELFKYFVDEDGKFIHYGEVDLFAEIAEKLEANTAKLNYKRLRFLEKPREGITYDLFVNTIRERTRKMSLIEKRFEPMTPLSKKKRADDVVV